MKPTKPQTGRRYRFLRVAQNDQNLTAVEKNVLTVLWLRYPNIRPGLTRIAEDANLSRRTVCRAVLALERAGWIEVARGGPGRGANLYRLRLEATPADDEPEPGGDSPDTRPGDAPVTSSGDTGVTQTAKENSQKEQPAARPPSADSRPAGGGSSRPRKTDADPAPPRHGRLAARLAEAGDYADEHADPEAAAAADIARLEAVSRRSGRARAKVMMEWESGVALRQWIAREVADEAPSGDADDGPSSSPPEPADGPWARVRRRLRDEVGEGAFRSWLRGLELIEHRDGRVRLAAPTRFMRDWIAANYADRLRALWRVESPEIRDVELIVGSG